MLARRSPALLLAALLAACPASDGDDVTDTDTDSDTDEDTDVSTTDAYEFPGRNDEASSVAYTGQVFRHLLIHDLTAHVEGLTARLDGGFFPEDGEIVEELDFYFRFDSSTSGSIDHAFTSTPTPAQTTYDDVSSDKDLVGKIAGNDAVGQHEDWTTDFVGWDAEGVTTPESLVTAWFEQLDDAGAAWANGTIAAAPGGDPVPAVYVTAEGHDLKQLIQKFLLGAVAFSQAADDYLDDDTEGKGLLSSHAIPDEGAYTDLEHQWDEGFGYFGATRDYGDWTDDQIADDVARDVWDADGAIDLTTEVCWGHSTNAAKRDRGANTDVDLTAEAWDGFLEGRRLLAGTSGELTPEQLEELKGWRDQALSAWEAAIAATVVHYINDTLQDMGDIGTDDYAFADHAKHWSELKGFALSFQFNPRSALTDTEFEDLHDLIGTSPVLSDASEQDRDAYADDLLEARALLGEAFGFHDDDLGDDDGTNGW